MTPRHPLALVQEVLAQVASATDMLGILANQRLASPDQPGSTPWWTAWDEAVGAGGDPSQVRVKLTSASRHEREVNLWQAATWLDDSAWLGALMASRTPTSHDHRECLEKALLWNRPAAGGWWLARAATEVSEAQHRKLLPLATRHDWAFPVVLARLEEAPSSQAFLHAVNHARWATYLALIQHPCLPENRKFDEWRQLLQQAPPPDRNNPDVQLLDEAFRKVLADPSLGSNERAELLASSWSNHHPGMVRWVASFLDDAEREDWLQAAAYRSPERRVKAWPEGLMSLPSPADSDSKNWLTWYAEYDSCSLRSSIEALIPWCSQDGVANAEGTTLWHFVMASPEKVETSYGEQVVEAMCKAAFPWPESWLQACPPPPWGIPVSLWRQTHQRQLQAYEEHLLTQDVPQTAPRSGPKVRL